MKLIEFDWRSHLFALGIWATASDHVEDGTNGKAAADHPADPIVELGEGQRGAEYVEEWLDPEGVHEGAILMDVADLQNDAKEE